MLRTRTTCNDFIERLRSASEPLARRARFDVVPGPPDVECSASVYPANPQAVPFWVGVSPEDAADAVVRIGRGCVYEIDADAARRYGRSVWDEAIAVLSDAARYGFKEQVAVFRGRDVGFRGELRRSSRSRASSTPAD
jgi:hypothetical protein